MSRAAAVVVMLRVAAALQRPRTVVLTGGPCSGKTTALETLPGRLPCGSKVLRVKEAATLYHERGGALPFARGEPDRDELWEAWLVELKLSLENAALRRASRLPGPAVVVCDRGALDSRAYCADAAAWGRVLALGGWSEADLAGRYDACVHFSVAPEEAYDFGNAARTETHGDAVALGGRVLDAWRGAAAAHGGPAPAALADAATFPAKLTAAHDAIAAAAAAPPRDGPPPPALALPAAYVVGQADRVARADDLAALRGPSAAVLRHVQRLRRRHELQQAFRVERPKAPAARAWAANVTSR